MLPASRVLPHPPEGHQIENWKRRAPENTILSQLYRRRVSTDGLNHEGSQLAASLEGEPGPTPAGKTLPHLCPETRFRRYRARVDVHETVTEGGRRSMATWRKEEVDAVRHRQEKRVEATRLRKSLLRTEAKNFAKRQPIGLVDESKESLYGRETDRDLRSA